MTAGKDLNTVFVRGVAHSVAEDKVRAGTRLRSREYIGCRRPRRAPRPREPLRRVSPFLDRCIRLPRYLSTI